MARAQHFAVAAAFAPIAFRPPPGFEQGGELPHVPPPPAPPAPTDRAIGPFGSRRRRQMSLSSDGAASGGSSSPSSSPRSPTNPAAAPSGPNSLGGYVPGRALRDLISQGKAPVLQLSLDDAVSRPMSGTSACPTVGSAGHWLGVCRPCEYVHRGLCTNGAACKYCHVCGPEVCKQLRKEKRLMKKVARRLGGAPGTSAAATGGSALQTGRH
mmetsp:Transcript_62146/g.180204  ORF Transcript_62146/g.180204 Transcript_62146/m.180204 type:complete len:212 (-) Transcript_62146:313-948(-)